MASASTESPAWCQGLSYRTPKVLIWMHPHAADGIHKYIYLQEVVI